MGFWVPMPRVVKCESGIIHFISTPPNESSLAEFVIILLVVEIILLLPCILNTTETNGFQGNLKKENTFKSSTWTHLGQK